MQVSTAAVASTGGMSSPGPSDGLLRAWCKGLVVQPLHKSSDGVGLSGSESAPFVALVRPELDVMPRLRSRRRPVKLSGGVKVCELGGLDDDLSVHPAVGEVEVRPVGPVASDD